LAFAFILFDRSHPYVRSVLARQHYWDALDQRAGQHLSVFSLDVRPAGGKAAAENRSMYAIEAPNYERASAALANYFDGLGNVTKPCVLFFQVAGEKVIDTAAVTVSQTDLTTTYSELEAVIGAAADAVAKVSNENAKRSGDLQPDRDSNSREATAQGAYRFLPGCSPYHRGCRYS
jgi:hypothetical protein